MIAAVGILQFHHESSQHPHLGLSPADTHNAAAENVHSTGHAGIPSDHCHTIEREKSEIDERQWSFLAGDHCTGLASTAFCGEVAGRVFMNRPHNSRGLPDIPGKETSGPDRQAEESVRYL